MMSEAVVEQATALLVVIFSTAGALSGLLTGISVAVSELGTVLFQALKNYLSSQLPVLGNSASQQIGKFVSGGYAGAGVASGIITGSTAPIKDAFADWSAHKERFPAKQNNFGSVRVCTVETPVMNGCAVKKSAGPSITPIVANGQAHATAASA